uniref:Uncharacterized protein n=1 Tax=Opuntia streptacantha TaxID=393608 RepID=A0A7C9AX65_OPUST
MLQWGRRVRLLEIGIVILVRRLLLVWLLLVLVEERLCMISGCSTKTKEWILASLLMISTMYMTRACSLLKPHFPPSTNRRKTSILTCMEELMSSLRRSGTLIGSNPTRGSQGLQKKLARETGLLSLSRLLRRLIHSVWISS